MSAPADGWKEAKDPQGRTYYYHASTKQTAWSLPPGAILLTKKKRRANTTMTGSSSPALNALATESSEMKDKESALSPNISASKSQSSVPADTWIECREVASGRTLFYNSTTLQISFDRKPGAGGAITSPSATSKKATPFLASSSSSSSNGDEDEKALADPFAGQVENPINARERLLDYKRTGWDYSNPRCEYFRAQAARVPHHEFQPSVEALVCPRYFSTAPVPPNPSGTFSVLVRLPPNLLKNSAMSSTKLFLKSTDSANEAIEKALKKCTDNLDPSEFVFKVVGRGEYIYGPEPVMDYESVRYCQRHQQEVTLSLVHMPLSVRSAPKFPAEWLHPVQYERKYIETEVYGNSDFAQTSLKAGAPRPDQPTAFNDWRFIPLSDLKNPYRIKVIEVANPKALPRWSFQMESIIVKTELRVGETTIRGSALQTRPAQFPDSPVFQQWLTTPNNLLQFAQLPRETRLCMQVYGITAAERKEVLLGYVNQQLLDARGVLMSGRHSLKLWALPDSKPQDTELNFLTQGPSWENLAAKGDAASVLSFELDRHDLPVISPLKPTPITINEDYVGKKVIMQADKLELLEKIVTADPLRDMTEDDKKELWRHRHHFTSRSSVLSKFLQCVDWCDRQKAAEAHRLLGEWKSLDPYEAFELLDSRYPDTTVREYAVNSLRNLSDSELAELLLQFTQVLKYEPYHESPIARFLIERCLRNPYQLGHYFFWHLKAEMHNHDFCERYGLLLEEYLTHNGFHAVELAVQDRIVKRLLQIADLIIHCKNVKKLDAETCRGHLRKEMEKLNTELPDTFQVSLNPRWVAKRIKPEKCKYMSSKKLPLWLVFENADAEGADIYAIFKSGDDLRQDILTLQLLRMMDRIWLANGLDLRLKPYSVIATGVNPENEGVGMIEIVLNSTTISDVQIRYGGGALGALKMSPLDDYIREKNPDQKKYDEAVGNFCRSCAGYCVATYVLGIGDRHNGNIMMTESGHLFHIDFGHFLGNFKSKFGFKRERSPFVFTPEMAYVMGGEDYTDSKLYQNFVDMCCQANNILRKHGSLWIAMFVLMQTAGMPELTGHEDVYYLRDMLNLGVSEAEASTKFQGEITGSVNEKWRRFDNAIHNAIHG